MKFSILKFKIKHTGNNSIKIAVVSKLAIISQEMWDLI